MVAFRSGIYNAEIAQLVEHNLAKVGVASSSLVFRSTHSDNRMIIAFFVRFAEIFRDYIDNPDHLQKSVGKQKKLGKNSF